MLKLRSKPCHIGPGLNGRTQRHGEERVPYMDVTISVNLTAKETGAILSEPHVGDAWFETKDGKLADPLLKNMQPYKFKGKFVNSLATITVGVHRTQIDFGDCTLNKLVFVPLSDGRTELKLKIQAAATTGTIPIFLWLDHDADVLLQFGEQETDESQQDLDLEVDDAPETAAEAIEQDEEEQQAAEQSEKPEPRRRGRKPIDGATIN